MRICKYMLVKPLLLAAMAAPVYGDAYDAPAGYYSSATGTGTTLKSQLASIMTTGHIQRNYGSFRYASVLFDTDPNNSSNILLAYNRASVSGSWDSGSTWNREHVWPQSLQPGSASNSSTGNLGDHHALRPANPGINSSRSNRPFGNLNSSGTYGIQTGGTWYPGDADAGDIARQLFYSDTRYDATLNDLSTGLVGDINTLVHWNYVDPPDDFERRRNHVIYSSSENPFYYTNNRNAYIDHPEYVWSVFGGGNNDSQLSVVGLPASDGSSSTTVDLGRVIKGSAVPADQTVSLIKTGDDPTYYDVSTSGSATSSINGRYNTFMGGFQFANVDAGLDTSTAAAGLKTGAILINNLDVSSSGTGRGSADADDVITVNLDVLDHSNASFASGIDQDLLTIDFGSVPVGGVLGSAFELYNLEDTAGFTADLDLDSIIGSGDTATLYSNLATFSGLGAGLQSLYMASFDTSVAGSFTATYTLNLSDEDIAGATNQVLTLQLLGEVTSLPGDLDGDGFVGLLDLDIILNNWNQNVPPADPAADPTGDNFVGLADLDIVLNNWNAGTPPGTAAIPEPASLTLLGLAGLTLIRRH